MRMPNFKNINRRIRYFLNDKERKPILTAIKEMIQLTLVERALPYHYLTKFLYRKGENDFAKHLTLREERLITKTSLQKNSDFINKISKNKLMFHLYAKNFPISTPSLLGWNMQNQFFVPQEVSPEGTLSEQRFSDYLRRIIDEECNVFCKPFNGQGGDGCFQLDKEKIKKINIAKLKDYLFEKKITQHEIVNQIYKKSLNTIRFTTFRDEKGLILLSAYMRFGAGGNVMDNISSGGFFVSVDKEGVLGKYGYKNFFYGGEKLKSHPDTGITFEGFKIPYYREAIHLVRQCAGFLPGVLMGWDVGISVKGPVLVEPNNFPGMTSLDIAYGGFRNHPMFHRVSQVFS